MTHAPRLAASLVVVTACVCSAGGVAARQGTLTPQGQLAAVPTVITRDTVLLAADRLLVERMYPPKPPGPGGREIGLPIDLQILIVAGQSVDPRVREAFVRSLGRFEQPADVEQLLPYLYDVDLNVRYQATRAIVQSLVNAKPEDDSRFVQMAFDALKLTALAPSVPPSRGRATQPTFSQIEILRNQALVAIGELPLNPGQTPAAAVLFAQFIDRAPASEGALIGLATLARRRPDVTVSRAALERLRILAAPRGPSEGAPTLSALKALRALRDRDDRVINFAATYHCKPLPDGCWEFRYIATQMVDASETYARSFDAALRDSVYHVRMVGLRAASASIPLTQSCLPLTAAFSDPVPYVVLLALDLLTPRCDEHDEIADRLVEWTHELSEPANATKWLMAAHALEALVKFRPEDARRIATEIAAPHEQWQVRALAARMAGALKDEALAVRMLKDDEPNVRTEALLSLAEMRSDKRVEAALDALQHRDYQLVFTAAHELSRAALGEVVARSLGTSPQEALMNALRRLTDEKKQTSRDPRLELIARIAEYGDVKDDDGMAELEKYLKDEDPMVASAVADAIGKLTGVRPTPMPTRPKLAQPNETDLVNIRRPPPGMTMGTHIWLSDGSHIWFRLAPEDAPLTVFRFKQLADAGYYDGLSFYRVVPGLLIQSGSPGENAYMGHAQFSRDEIGLPHDAGAVAVPTRGRHTGDGQFFIDLLDNPQFDHLYTVFGTDACFTAHVLEGVKITKLLAFAPEATLPPCVNITPVNPQSWPLPPR